MGWTSTADAQAHNFNSMLVFDTKESAQAFCDKHGWEWEVMEPQKMGKGASTIPGRGSHSLTSELNLRTFGTHPSRQSST